MSSAEGSREIRDTWDMRDNVDSYGSNSAVYEISQMVAMTA